MYFSQSMRGVNSWRDVIITSEGIDKHLIGSHRPGCIKPFSLVHSLCIMFLWSRIKSRWQKSGRRWAYSVGWISCHIVNRKRSRWPLIKMYLSCIHTIGYKGNDSSLFRGGVRVAIRYKRGKSIPGNSLSTVHGSLGYVPYVVVCEIHRLNQ